MTTDAGVDLNPTWSSNGEQIYFTSNRSGSSHIWSIRLKSQELRQQTKTGAVKGQTSKDGNWIFLSKAEHPGLWKYSLKDGVIHVSDYPQAEFVYQWALGENGFFYVQTFEAKQSISYFDFETRTSKVVNIQGNVGLISVSPDGTQLIFNRIDKKTIETVVPIRQHCCWQGQAE